MPFNLACFPDESFHLERDRVAQTATLGKRVNLQGADRSDSGQAFGLNEQDGRAGKRGETGAEGRSLDASPH